MILSMLEERLENKMKELKRKQEIFIITCKNDIKTPCFEQNAIADLVVMQKIKSEIEEIKYWIMMEKGLNISKSIPDKCMDCKYYHDEVMDCIPNECDKE